MKKISLVLMCATLLVACGGGGGSSDESSPQDPSNGDSNQSSGTDESSNDEEESANDESSNDEGEDSAALVSGTRVIYSTDNLQSSASAVNLFIAGTGSPMSSVKVSEVQISDELFNSYVDSGAHNFSYLKFGPKKNEIFFTKNTSANSSGRHTLKSVNLSNVSTERALTDTNFVNAYKINSEANKILFMSRPKSSDDNVIVMYLLDLDNPTQPLRISDDAIEDVDLSVYGFDFVNDEKGAIYIAGDRFLPRRPNIYYVDFANPAAAIRVNAPYPELSTLRDEGAGTQSIFNVEISHDGNSVFYLANGSNPGIFVTDLSTLGESRLLAADVGSNFGFQLGPNGRIFYLHRPIGKDSLESVDPTTGDTINYSRTCRDIRVSPDGSKLACRSDAETSDQFELFLVDVMNPSNARKLSGPMTAGGDVAKGGYQFTPDSERVIYLADQEENNTRELFMVRVSNPGSSTKVSDSLVFGGDVTRQETLQNGVNIGPESDAAFEMDSTGQKLIYRADQDSDDVYQLYIVDLATPGQSARLNPPLADENRDVIKFNVDN